MAKVDFSFSCYKEHFWAIFKSLGITEIEKTYQIYHA